MGNFYVNFAVRGAAAQEVAGVLRAAGRRAMVLPEKDGYVIVVDKAADSQSSQAIEEVGVLLSDKLFCAVLAVLNHDGDVLCYWLFDLGRVVDRYISDPGYWDDDARGTDPGGQPMVLCEVLEKRGAEQLVEKILFDQEFAFALDRHRALVTALGLPEWSVAAGYQYLTQGYLPKTLTGAEVIRVG